MRDYGKVHTSIWTSATVREMSEDGRTLALYLLTCSHGTIAGVFRIPDGYASDDLQWGSERVSEGFAELKRKGFATRCETTKWAWVIKHFEWNPLENPNQRKAAHKIASQIPEKCEWRLDFIKEYGVLFGMEAPAEPEKTEPFRNPSETLPESVTVTVTGTGTGTVTRTSRAESENFPESLFPAASLAGPEKNHGPEPETETNLQAACRITWCSYAEAYGHRYGAAPVRNAKVSSAVKALVKRIGAEETPLLAAWFIGHTDAFYVRKMHDIGCLLADCEKLHTEWVTGRQMTGVTARQHEQSAGNFAAAEEAIRNIRDRSQA